VTIAQYVDAVVRLARQRGLAINEADAESGFHNAADSIAASLIGTPRASLLQRRFQVDYTGTDFNALFSTILLATGGSLASANIDHIRTESITKVSHDDGAGTVTVFHRIPGDSEYDFDRAMEFTFYDPYIVLNAKIRAKKADQSTLADGQLTFEAGYTPLIGGLPASGELDADVIERGVMLASAQKAANG
jgi:hypothetical protein